MKTKKVIFVISLIGILFGFISCEEPDPIFDPGEDPTDTQRYTIEISYSKKGGYTTPKGTYEVVEFTDFSVIITTAFGYDIDTFLVDGILTSPTNYYTFSNIQKSHQVYVTFKKNDFGYLTGTKAWKSDSIYVNWPDDGLIGYKTWGVPGELQKVVSFYPDGTYRDIWNGQEVGDGPWSINDTVDPHILTQGSPYEILTLNDSCLRTKNYNGNVEVFSPLK